MIANKNGKVFFAYGEEEIGYLKQKDKVLGAVIDQIGLLRREVNPDLFSATIHAIIGQQIAIKAQRTVWKRMNELLGVVSAEAILDHSICELQAVGMTFKKAKYIRAFAQRVLSGEFAIDTLRNMSDAEVVCTLSALPGIGVWTAEMLMLFSMQRPNVMSYSDVAIHRGLRMVHHHRRIDKKLFEKYRRRYSPYCSVASLYLWDVAVGAIPEMRDYAPKRKLK